VVSTASGGPDEILQDGEHGRLVPVGHEEALAAAMEEALSGDRLAGAEERIARAETLSGAASAERYLALMLGTGPARRAPLEAAAGSDGAKR
jgi:glycosyltransferase involved in cell wall biosynthesis